MQDSSAGVQRQLSIGKKKGGFLFANAPEKTPEDLRREEEDRQRQEQEFLERQHAAPAAPSNIPLATLGSYKEEDEEDNMATASSLKERLKQYQSLKAEQENAAKGISTDSNSFLGPPIDKPESAEVNQDEETKDERPPEESWVPRADEVEEGITVEEEVEFPGAEEQYDEEEVVFDDVGEEVEEEEMVEEITDGNDEYEEEEIVGESTTKLDTAESVDMDQEMDVFRALDEAEKAERTLPAPPPPPPPPQPSSALEPLQSPSSPPEQPPPVTSYKSRDAMPQRDENKFKQNAIIIVLVLVGLIAILAVVLPFVLDYNRDGDSTSISGGPSPTVAPVTLPTTPTAPPKPTVSPAPTSTPIPTAEFQTTAPVPGTNSEPSMEPTTLRLAQFIGQFLVPISGSEVFEDKSSPQYRAAVYIADVDPFTSQLTNEEQLADRYAAITFYYATSGDEWTRCYLGDESSCSDQQWLVDDVCGWFSVSCDDVGRINGFLFSESNGLSGSLPIEISLISEMSNLIIVNNSITGTLPEAFGTNSTNMESILLQGNSLTGSIPDDFLASSPLQIAILADNAFSGPVPIGMGSGTFLQILDLSGNALTGNVPTSMDSYETLRELNLAFNNLEGDIPESLYSITTMERLFLNDNPFTGTLSGSVRGMSSLQILNIGNSMLEGFLPDELYDLTNLVEVDISGNGFSGQLSFGFGRLAVLRRLMVDNNLFGGTVPDSFGQLSALNVLELQGNGISGSIASSICALVDSGVLQVLTADCSEVTCDCCTECF